jgi:hypothetical protein
MSAGLAATAAKPEAAADIVRPPVFCSAQANPTPVRKRPRKRVLARKIIALILQFKGFLV